MNKEKKKTKKCMSIQSQGNDKHTCWMCGANFSRAWEYGKIAWVWTKVSVIEKDRLIIKKHKNLFNRTNGELLTRAGYPRNETFHTLNSPKSTCPIYTIEHFTLHLLKKHHLCHIDV